ncbi:hypothetical protein BDR07DRAFT_1424218, partial [Suillus spraguei]
MENAGTPKMTVGVTNQEVRHDGTLCLRRLFDHKQDRVTRSTSSPRHQLHRDHVGGQRASECLKVFQEVRRRQNRNHIEHVLETEQRKSRNCKK